MPHVMIPTSPFRRASIPDPHPPQPPVPDPAPEPGPSPLPDPDPNPVGDGATVDEGSVLAGSGPTSQGIHGADPDDDDDLGDGEGDDDQSDPGGDSDPHPPLREPGAAA